MFEKLLEKLGEIRNTIFTKEDDWQNHQQRVSAKSPNLYAVTEDQNEIPLTGDGYSVTNGVVKEGRRSGLDSFFKEKMSSVRGNSDGERISVVKYESPGLIYQPSEIPKLEELVQKDSNGSLVSVYRGTVNSPNVYKNVSDRYIFTDDGPNQNDVKQRSVGDCYFWGTVLQILAQDKNKILDIVKLVGTNVETTLFYKENSSWVAQTYTRPIGIGGLNSRYVNNDYTEKECGVRVDIAKPSESAWEAVISGPSCLINRTDYYKAALWANCLEQAYSDFTREHGKYGDGFANNPGTEEFVNGQLDACMHMFYGDKSSDAKPFAVSNNLGSQFKLIQTLVSYKKTRNTKGRYSALGLRGLTGDPVNGGPHAYSIENVTFMNANGDIIDFTDNGGLGAVFSDLWEYHSIDLTNSKVLLRNPWNSTDAQDNDGKFFEISLNELLNDGKWTHVYHATIAERTATE